MADLQSIREQRNLFGNRRSPFNGWVYESNYKMFLCDPDSVPDSRAKFDSVGHRMMNAINPNWVVVRSYTGQVMMLVDGNRWDSASIKQTMDEQVYQVTAEDTVWTVTESDGAWYDNYDNVSHGDENGNVIIDTTLSYWRTANTYNNAQIWEQPPGATHPELRPTIQFDITTQIQTPF